MLNPSLKVKVRNTDTLVEVQARAKSYYTNKDWTISNRHIDDFTMKQSLYDEPFCEIIVSGGNGGDILDWC